MRTMYFYYIYTIDVRENDSMLTTYVRNLDTDQKDLMISNELLIITSNLLNVLQQIFKDHRPHRLVASLFMYRSSVV